MPTTFNQIEHRLTIIRNRISAAARAAGRDPATIRLVAVSKRHPAEAVRAALSAGQLDFGENYASELADKAAHLPDEICWHLIGPLQRRQAGSLPRNTALWHTLDRIKILERFRHLERIPPPCLVQVNIGKEPQKSGIAPEDVRAFLERIQQQYPEVQVRGLMTIPPAGAPEQTRPWFAALRELAATVSDLLPDSPELSMGMSGDFEQAIAEGATIVRVGSAIFGPRPTDV
ncbi:MAG: YggS family pyridoxal phosphate-dependent enzyme [Candidatus Dadabacteria bacterium]|nr:MAG: YggS family pyridoxal phosphate-dependent enzyme [Candidatus Dadabacteria bacterium]